MVFVGLNVKKLLYSSSQSKIVSSDLKKKNEQWRMDENSFAPFFFCYVPSETEPVAQLNVLSAL